MLLLLPFPVPTPGLPPTCLEASLLISLWVYLLASLYVSLVVSLLVSIHVSCAWYVPLEARIALIPWKQVWLPWKLGTSPSLAQKAVRTPWKQRWKQGWHSSPGSRAALNIGRQGWLSFLGNKVGSQDLEAKVARIRVAFTPWKQRWLSIPEHKTGSRSLEEGWGDRAGQQHRSVRR